MNNKKLTVIRALTALGLCALICLITAILLLNPTENTLLPCALNKTFGIHCATCGATRAVYYFFTFQFKKAFYYHAYFVTLSPLLAYIITGFCVNVFAGKKVVPFPKPRWYYLVAFFAGLLCFGVLRNFTMVIY